MTGQHLSDGLWWRHDQVQLNWLRWNDGSFKSLPADFISWLQRFAAGFQRRSSSAGSDYVTAHEDRHAEAALGRRFTGCSVPAEARAHTWPRDSLFIWVKSKSDAHSCYMWTGFRVNSQMLTTTVDGWGLFVLEPHLSTSEGSSVQCHINVLQLSGQKRPPLWMCVCAGFYNLHSVDDVTHTLKLCPILVFFSKTFFLVNYYEKALQKILETPETNIVLVIEILIPPSVFMCRPSAEEHDESRRKTEPLQFCMNKQTGGNGWICISCFTSEYLEMSWWLTVTKKCNPEKFILKILCALLWTHWLWNHPEDWNQG